MLSSSEDEKNATSSKEKKDTLASSSDEDARPANNKTALLASSSEEDNSDSGKKITSRAALESGKNNILIFSFEGLFIEGLLIDFFVQTRIELLKISFELYFNAFACLICNSKLPDRKCMLLFNA